MTAQETPSAAVTRTVVDRERPCSCGCLCVRVEDEIGECPNCGAITEDVDTIRWGVDQ